VELRAKSNSTAIYTWLLDQLKLEPNCIGVVVDRVDNTLDGLVFVKREF
jgi:hypothetical protein